MEKAEVLKIEPREPMSGRANNRLRKSGYITGSIYGKGKEGSIPIAIAQDALRKALAKNGRSALFKLQLEKGKAYDAIVKDIQIAPIGGKYLNVSFQEISLKEEAHMDVPIRVEGKDVLMAKKLVLSQQVDMMALRGLPTEIPNALHINVEKMEAGDKLFVKDIELPKGIVTNMDPEQLVIAVAEQQMNVFENEEAAGENAEAEASGEEEKAATE